MKPSTPLPVSTQAAPIAEPQPVPVSATPPAVVSIGNSIITADSSSQFVIGSQTLAPGAAPITRSRTVISLPSSGKEIVIGPSTQSILLHTPQSAPVITFGSSTLTADKSSQFHVGSQTLAPGGAITHGGQTVSLIAGGSSVVINGNTQQVSQQVATPTPVISLEGSQITANSQSQFVIGSQTLVAGSNAITISHQVLSLASSGDAVVFAARTQAITAPSHFVAIQPPILALDHSTITANSNSEYIVGGKTLHAGSPAITIPGSTISLAPSATAVIINGKTSSLFPQSILAAVAPPLITLGPSIIKAAKSGGYVIAGQTLSAGGSAITISGTGISLASEASELVIGSSTAHLSSQILALTTEAPILKIGTLLKTAVGPSALVYGGQTFEAGDMMTISGTMVSLAADDSYLKIGDSTSLLPKSDYGFGTQILEPGHAITVSGTVISLASDDSYLKIGSATEVLHAHTVTESTVVKPSGPSTARLRSEIRDPFTGSLVQAAPTVAPSPSGKSEGRRNYAGAAWLQLFCALVVVFGGNFVT